MYRADYLDSHNGNETGMMGFEDFLGSLAYQMIHNELDRESIERLHNTRKRSSTESDLQNSSGEINHDLRPLSLHPKYVKVKAEKNAETDGSDGESKAKSYRAQIRCKICTSKCSYYCIYCSVDDNFVGICNDRKRSSGESPNCLMRHREAFKDNLTCFNANAHPFSNMYY